MTTDWLKTLRDFGNAAYDAFFLPGDFLISQLVTQSPALALKLGIEADAEAVVLSSILSLLIWSLLAGVLWKFFRLLQNVTRRVTAALKAIVFRVSLLGRQFRTKLFCASLRLAPRRLSMGAESTPQLDFDDGDLAVLRTSAAAGWGFTVSAPDLAKQLPMGPAQVQRSLDKLWNYRMVDVVIGSTDGFDNYHLTQSGAAFLAVFQQRKNGNQPRMPTIGTL